MKATAWKHVQIGRILPVLFVIIAAGIVKNVPIVLHALNALMDLKYIEGIASKIVL